MYESYGVQHDGYGRPGENQDGYLSEERDGEYLFAVLDGHGNIDEEGRKSAELTRFISARLFDLFWEEKENGSSIPRAFLKSFDNLQQAIIKENINGGSTATVLHIDSNDNHYVTYVGDSPIYGVTDQEVIDLIGDKYYHRVRSLFKNGEHHRLLNYYSESDLRFFSNVGYLEECNMTRFLGNIESIGNDNHIPSVKTLKTKYDRYLLTTDGMDVFTKAELYFLLSLSDDMEDNMEFIKKFYSFKIKKTLEDIKNSKNPLAVPYFDNATALYIVKS